MIHYATLIVLCVSSQNTSNPPTIGSVDEAMALLRKSATTAREYRDLRKVDHAHGKAMAFLRSSPQVRPGDIVDLLEIVLPDRNNPSSFYILELACQRADNASALRIIKLMLIYGEQYFDVRAIAKPAKFNNTKTVDVSIMRMFLGQTNTLVKQMHDPRPLMELFYDWLMIQQSVKWKYMRRAADILMKAVTLPVSLDLRREYTLKILDNYRLMGEIPQEMVVLINDSMLPHLRKLVKQSVDDPEAFPVAVARYLADRGDLEILPFLNEIEAKTYPAEHLRNRKPEEVAGTISWRIKVQHPPQTLLRWLDMGPVSYKHDRYIDQGTRMWMMKQAMKLGLDKQAIREAVLTYVRQYIRAGHPHNIELPTVKRRAIDLGILQQGDLPEIKLSPVTSRNR